MKFFKRRELGILQQPTVPPMPPIKNPNPDYRPPMGKQKIVAVPLCVTRKEKGWIVKIGKKGEEVFLPDGGSIDIS